jgi:hypothetical protein
MGIILARRPGLVGGFAAYDALVALGTVRTVVWSVFRARRSSSTLLDRDEFFHLHI